MMGAKLFVYNVIVCLATSSKLLIRAEERLNSSRTGLNESRGLNVFPGIKFFLSNGEIIVRVGIRDLLEETEVPTGRKSEKSEKKKNPLKKFGFMMMMMPFVMQILSLPGAIASIKMSLLKSIMVAKLAVAIMIYNLIKSAQNEEVIVVHQPQHHTHYHHSHHSANDEDEWFGR